MKNSIFVFVDASNVWNAVKSVRKFIEYKKLKDYFKDNFNAEKVEIFITMLIQKMVQEITILMVSTSFTLFLRKD